MKKSKVDIDREIAEMEATAAAKSKKSKSWYVCYSFPDDPSRWWMLRVSARDGDEAWDRTLHRLKREGKKDAVLVYAKCVS